MPTYREDLHTGHQVPLIETDDIMNKAVTAEKLADGAVTAEKISAGAVGSDALSDGAVDGRVLGLHVVTEEHLSGELLERLSGFSALHYLGSVSGAGELPSASSVLSGGVYLVTGELVTTDDFWTGADNVYDGGQWVVAVDRERDGVTRRYWDVLPQGSGADGYVKYVDITIADEADVKELFATLGSEDERLNMKIKH